MKEVLLLPLRKVGRLLEHGWMYLGTLAAMALLVGTLGMAVYRMVEWRMLGADTRFYYGVVNHGDSKLPEGVGVVPREVLHARTRSCLRFEYGDDGRLLRFIHVDPSGNPVPLPGSSVAEQRLSYDDQGRLIAKRSFNAVGRAVEDSTGVASRLFSYDAAGNLVRTEHRSAAGELVVPALPGYAVEVVEYDEHNRPVVREYLDAEGNPTVNAVGESRLSYSYDDEAGVSVRENQVMGKKVENKLGFAVERRERSADGCHHTVLWMDAQGKPVLHPHVGAASLCVHKEPSTGYCREYFSSDASLLPQAVRGCAERMARYDRQGRLEWECFNAQDGLPCLVPCLGYAERLCRYGTDNRLQTEYFWDALGNPAPCYQKRYSAVEPDGSVAVLSLYADGSSSVCPMEEQPRVDGLASALRRVP